MSLAELAAMLWRELTLTALEFPTFASALPKLKYRYTDGQIFHITDYHSVLAQDVKITKGGKI